MPHKFNDARRHKFKKKRYRISNWSEYNESLRQRGDVTIWLSLEVEAAWRAERRKTRGGQPVYSDLAITVCLMLGMVYKQPLRQTEGFVRSLIKIMGLDLAVPDYSTFSRRGAGLVLPMETRAQTNDPIHLVVDSTGLKIFGEGEWKVRQHGVGKRRTWRKIHLAVDETEKDIIGIEVTTADWGDSEVFPDLLAQVDGEVAQVSADGAYDTEGCHRSIAERGAKATIPPRDGAVPWGDDHPRDAILQAIADRGRDGWKDDSGYHRRSLAENMMFRLKQLGDRMFSRTFERQVAEAHARVAILNCFTYLGMPQSVRAGQIAPAA